MCRKAIRWTTELLNGIVTHENRMVGLIDLHAVVSGAKTEA